MMKIRRFFALFLCFALILCTLPAVSNAEETSGEKVAIADCETIGTWQSTGDTYKGYDGDISTKWNPQSSGYEYGEGIIYKLKRTCDLTQAKITFGSRYYYFDIYTSTDGEAYSKIFSVDASNQYTVYKEGYVCTIENLQAENVCYVQVVFTGSIDNGVWVNLYEIEIYGTDAYANEETAVITTSTLEGTWENSGNNLLCHDGNLDSKWNPRTSGYSSGESIVYTMEDSYNIDALRLIFDTRYYFFDVLVSTDGEEYLPIVSITADNKSAYYASGYVCIVDGFTAENVKFVKIAFTGSSDSSKWINFYEIELYGNAIIAGDETEDPETITKIPIETSELSGTWVAIGDRAKGYDGDVTSKWNPQSSGYASGESIIFAFDGVYDLSQIEIIFGSRYYYFTVSTSLDGNDFTQIASITSDNQGSYYTNEYVCLLSKLDALETKYVQISFTGSSDNNAWINLFEIDFYGTQSGNLPQKATIVTAAVEGGWKTTGDISKAYDGSIETRWNPQSTGFESEEAAVFTLDRVYDLNSLQITVGSRYHYFKIFASIDGENYTQIADVNADNFSDYYASDYVCTISGLHSVKAQYIKVLFTGNSATTLNAFVNFDEIEVYGYEIFVTEWNLSLKDDLQVNFHLYIPQLDEQNTQINIEIGDTLQQVDLNVLSKLSDTQYVLPVHIAAAQMTDAIRIHMICGDQKWESSEYTVRQYADVILAEQSYEQYHLLIREMLHYGSEAQKYFDHSAAELADDGITGTALRYVPIMDPQGMSVTGRVSGTYLYGASLVFRDKVAVRFYFSSADGYSFTVNGESVTPIQKDGLYMLEAANILPQDLDEQCVVTVSDTNGNVQTVKYSPMNYVFRMSEKGSSELKALLTALYNYHLASETICGDEVNNATYLSACTDALGRPIEATNTSESEKAVGLFYFLSLGTGGNEVYDVSQILKNDPNAAQSNEAWLAAGGGAINTAHWWGKSIFGYYYAVDSWVIERDVMMLTDAGVDFLAIDYSNTSTFPQQLLVLLKALDKYYRQGYDVPQITFITKSQSGTQVAKLYNNAYLAYPEYSHLWYQMDGKPLIVADDSIDEIPEICRNYFTFRYSQWPRESYHADGFPWMDFGKWTADGKQAVFGDANTKTIMSVSVAQHKGTLAFSSSAFYGDTTNHTRSWHNGENDTAEDAYLYGYNFAEQFEYAISQNPDIIFITGWNEWIAGRQESWTGINGEITDPVILVDNADINNSRDIQPMLGGYGDNYYMQMISYIRKFKGQSATNVGLNTFVQPGQATISITGSMDQWDAIGGFYLDYLNDTADRNCLGYGGVQYTDQTGRNDIYQMKITNDGTHLYALVRTAEQIVGVNDGHCLTMFISTGIAGNATWCGYDYVIGRTQIGVIEKRTASGWEQIGTANYQIVNNELQFAVPLDMLGISAEDISIEFKFADNYQDEDNLDSFYLGGDCAPYGRMNYIYQSTFKAG